MLIHISHMAHRVMVLSHNILLPSFSAFQAESSCRWLSTSFLIILCSFLYWLFIWCWADILTELSVIIPRSAKCVACCPSFYIFSEDCFFCVHHFVYVHVKSPISCCYPVLLLQSLFITLCGWNLPWLPSITYHHWTATWQLTCLPGHLGTFWTM